MSSRVKKVSMRRTRAVHAVRSKSGLLIAFAVMLAVFAVLTRGRFLEVPNLINLVRTVSLYAPVAFAMTLCLAIGGIDLSVGSLCAVASTYSAGLIANYGVNIWVAVAIGIAMAIVMGLVNGLLISRTSMPPFIVTLSMMQMARGVAYIYSAGKPIRTPMEFGDLANGYLFDVIPYPIIVMIVVMIVMIILLNKTKFGRNVYAIGGNREAARFSGINVPSTTMWVYVISGILCGICGVIWASRLYSGQPELGRGAEMAAIASAIVGGTSMTGGSGTIGGTLLGAFVIQTLTSGLNYLNVPFYYQFVVQGLVIIIAVYIDIRRKEAMARSS